MGIHAKSSSSSKKLRNGGKGMEVTKYVLVHYTRNSKQKTNASVTINGITIKPCNEAKYLGVIFDQGLRSEMALRASMLECSTRSTRLESSRTRIPCSKNRVEHKSHCSIPQCSIETLDSI